MALFPNQRNSTDKADARGDAAARRRPGGVHELLLLPPLLLLLFLAIVVVPPLVLLPLRLTYSQAAQLRGDAPRDDPRRRQRGQPGPQPALPPRHARRRQSVAVRLHPLHGMVPLQAGRGRVVFRLYSKQLDGAHFHVCAHLATLNPPACPPAAAAACPAG